MKAARLISLLALAGLILATSSVTASAEGIDSSEISRESGAQMVVEYLDRVEFEGETAVFVFDVEDQEHEVEFDMAEIGDDLQERLTDEQTDLVDIAAFPVLGGALLKIAGFLLRLGRL